MISLYQNLNKDWSLRNEILKRVNLEAEIDWAMKNTQMPLPKYEPIPKQKKSWGLLASIMI